MCTTCGCGTSDGRGIAFDGASAGRTSFSCKGRSVCPSCNARRMAETAAHLADHVFPPLPVRQCVLSVPKRLRYFLQHDLEAISVVLHILLRVIEAQLLSCWARQKTRHSLPSLILRVSRRVWALCYGGVIPVGERRNASAHFVEAFFLGSPRPSIE